MAERDRVGVLRFQRRRVWGQEPARRDGHRLLGLSVDRDDRGGDAVVRKEVGDNVVADRVQMRPAERDQPSVGGWQGPARAVVVFGDGESAGIDEDLVSRGRALESLALGRIRTRKHREQEHSAYTLEGLALPATRR